MAAQVKAVPPGFHTLTPHLTVRDADKALEFYKNALGARSCTWPACQMERSCMPGSVSETRC
jgi:uncharacterized glyoxalase superfamily protein PhnB